jgi:1-phosphatidylinositol phosphodiesterase
MSCISGSKMISELTIPGTHDSASYTASSLTGFGFVKTQDLSITEQLNAGCRFLDIRCRLYHDNLVLHHGSFYLDLNFTDVINFCRDFLKQNPKECILLSLKEEYDREGNTITYEQAFMKYHAMDKSLWHVGDTIPKLDEVRGKIVLLRRFSLDQNLHRLGIDLSFSDNTTFTYQFSSTPNQTFSCEDLYNPDSVAEKLGAILNHVSKAKHRSK